MRDFITGMAAEPTGTVVLFIWIVVLLMALVLILGLIFDNPHKRD